jgi:hypothetical protein
MLVEQLLGMANPDQMIASAEDIHVPFGNITIVINWSYKHDFMNSENNVELECSW